MFTDSFDTYACEGDTISTEIGGITYTARIERDNDTNINDDDCHNPDRSVTGCSDEQQAKVIAARDAWYRDDWFYCGVVISAEKAGVTLDEHAAALWGIECNYPYGNNDYLSEVANELLLEAVDRACEVLAALRASS